MNRSVLRGILNGNKATIGNVEVTAVIDMVPPPRELSAMFPDVPNDAWANYQDTLEDGQLQLYYGVFLLKTEEHVILVDTGMGPGPHPDRGNLTGNLYEELRPHLESNVGVNNTTRRPERSELHSYPSATRHRGLEPTLFGGNAGAPISPRPATYVPDPTTTLHLRGRAPDVSLHRPSGDAAAPAPAAADSGRA